MKARRANHVSQYVVQTYQSSVKTDALGILTHQLVCDTLSVLAHFNQILLGVPATSSGPRGCLRISCPHLPSPQTRSSAGSSTQSSPGRSPALCLVQVEVSQFASTANNMTDTEASDQLLTWCSVLDEFNIPDALKPPKGTSTGVML